MFDEQVVPLQQGVELVAPDQGVGCGKLRLDRLKDLHGSGSRVRLALLAHAGEDERLLDLLVRTGPLGRVEGLSREVELAADSPDAALGFASDYMSDFAAAFFLLHQGSCCVPGRGCEARPRRSCGK